jgi:peroxiredoxin
MNYRRSLILAAGALGSLGVLRAFAVEPGKRAPHFEAVDTTNRKRRLSEFKGKTVVLEWTSPSCPYVRAQYGGAMQEVQAWATKQDVVWLSVLSTHPSRRDWLPPDKAGAMSRSRGAAPTALVLDPEGAMGRAYGAVVTPHMFIIAPNGNIAYAGAIGDRSTMDAKEALRAKNYVKAALEDLAAGRAVAVPSSRPFGCTIAYSGQ